MTRFLDFFLTWWGAVVLAALDTSLLMFMPFGIDAVVIYLAARNQSLFWLYPLLATFGSLCGAALTYWIGYKAGEVGLSRFVAEPTLARLRRRLSKKGAVALAVPAILPPPFPLTAFVATCGALQVNPLWFFGTFGAVRLFRFTVGALLARTYGQSILRVFESDAFQNVVVAFVIVAIVGTAISIAIFLRGNHRRAITAS